MERLQLVLIRKCIELLQKAMMYENIHCNDDYLGPWVNYHRREIGVTYANYLKSKSTGLRTQKTYTHTGTSSSQCVHQICSCIYSFCQILLLSAHACMHLYCN